MDFLKIQLFYHNDIHKNSNIFKTSYKKYINSNKICYTNYEQHG